MRGATERDGDERLSSRWGTFFIRFVWPIFGLGSIPGFPISLLWWRPETPVLVAASLAVFVGMPAYYWFVSRPLRWVWAGPDGLRVSDGRTDVRVPYSAIEDVREAAYVRGFVRVHLDSPTPVGRRIAFITTWRLGSRDVVTRLRDRARLAPR